MFGIFISIFLYTVNCYYTLSHRQCGHPRHLCRATFADFEVISTTTGCWIRSRRSNPTARRSRNHLEVCKSCMTKVTRVTTLLDGTEYIHSVILANFKRGTMFIDCSSWNNNLQAYGIRIEQTSSDDRQYWHLKISSKNINTEIHDCESGENGQPCQF